METTQARLNLILPGGARGYDQVTIGLQGEQGFTLRQRAVLVLG